MLIALLFISAAAEDTMYHFDPVNGEEYDWSELQRKPNDPYKIDAGDSYFIFNVGSNLEETCKGQKASAIKKSKFSDDCEVIGRNDQIFYRLLDHYAKGISIEYWTDETCISSWNDFETRKMTTITLICNPKEYDFELVSRTDACEIKFSKKTYIGCPQKFSSYVWLRILWSVLGAIFVVAALFACVICIFEDEEWDEDENQPKVETGPVWREMKTIVRKGKNWGKSTYSNMRYSRTDYEKV
ncbi:unnamed protein product [Blepharisma stoltei]|uniref:MRH domain-containing protein n=1 Tax=Blepharisma stoltei TaxID=1481888 RepID=A0AAU9J4C5_9CILI|nr:unnamed protein product [Blepharisma stoltei]